MHMVAAIGTTWRTVPGEKRMKVEFTPEQERLRQELRAYFKALITPELDAELEESPASAGPRSSAGAA